MANTSGFLKNSARFTLIIKVLIGPFLVGIGAYAALLLVIIVFRIFVDIQNIPFLNIVTSFDARSIELISFGTATIKVSNTVLVYTIAIILLSFAGKLSFKILKLGTDMINKVELKFLYQELLKNWEKQNKNKSKPRVESIFSDNDSDSDSDSDF